VISHIYTEKLSNRSGRLWLSALGALNAQDPQQTQESNAHWPVEAGIFSGEKERERGRERERARTASQILFAFKIRVVCSITRERPWCIATADLKRELRLLKIRVL
jgi:hypothetical protein